MNVEQRKFIRNYLEYKRNTTKPTPKQKTINAESLNDYHDMDTQHRSRIYQPSLRQTNPKPRIWADLLPDDEKIG